MSTADEKEHNVLIVSHRMLICHLLSIIFNEMNCGLSSDITKVPDFRKGYREVKPANTCFSMFEVNICTENQTIEEMKCLKLLNSDHLECLNHV